MMFAITCESEITLIIINILCRKLCRYKVRSVFPAAQSKLVDPQVIQTELLCTRVTALRRTGCERRWCDAAADSRMLRNVRDRYLRF